MIRLFLCFAVLFISVSAYAQAEPLFFSAIPDLPLMEGLRELPELTTTFDKPEGRIIESTALIEAGTAEQVRTFYARTLPQMGWQVAGERLYARQNERLTLMFETDAGQHFLKVMVAPKD